MTSDSWDTQLYARLKAVAGAQMRDESGARTLHPTALLHEAWLRLADVTPPENTSELRALVSTTMRRVRVDAARRRRAACRDFDRSTAWTDDIDPTELQERDIYVLALDIALDRLATQLPKVARLVELRFFLGLENDEIARVLGWSTRTVKRRWQLARGWLHREVRGELAT